MPTGSRSPGSNGFVQIVFSEIPCNWFQCQENSIDPVHFEWLHSNWSRCMRGQDGPGRRATCEIGFDEFEYGFIYRRMREGSTETGRAVDGRPRVPVAELPLHRRAFEWRVPVDDDAHAERGWFYDPRARRPQPFEQDADPVLVRTDQAIRYSGRWITTHVMNQDFVAWVGQGTIADRTQEHSARATAASS